MPLNLAQINDILVEHLREHGRVPGTTLAGLVRRHDPGFRPQDLGYLSFSDLLRDAVDGAVVVGRTGADVLWALGEGLDDRALAQAMMEEENATKPIAGDALARVELEGFRSCRKVCLDLDDLTVLVGANGAGKTTLLLGTSYACQIRAGKIRALFSGARDLRRLRHTSHTGPVRFTLTTQSGAEVSLTGTAGADEVSFVLTHRARATSPRTRWTFPPPAGQKGVTASPVEGVSWPAVFLRLRSEALQTPAPIEDQHPRLDFDGSGLPAVLAYLATNEPGRLEEIIGRVRGLVPTVRRVRLPLRQVPTPDGSAERQFSYTLEVEFEGAGWIPADMVSEGTLFALGMHTVLGQPNPPKVLLMDDIDRGLHPRAQRTLIQQLLSVAESGTRLIVTSHSPYVLDEVPPENVRVVRSTPETGTLCRRLTDHPEWAAWQGSMKAGEFWSFVGEEWLE